MPSSPEQPRRRGAPPGNRNRLTHGLYTRLAVERRAATARIVADPRPRRFEATNGRKCTGEPPRLVAVIRPIASAPIGRIPGTAGRTIADSGAASGEGRPDR